MVVEVYDKVYMQVINIWKISDLTGFESERPTIFGLEEIEEATEGFHETRRIGEGGYGNVYLGLIGDRVICSPPAFNT